MEAERKTQFFLGANVRTCGNQPCHFHRREIAEDRQLVFALMPFVPPWGSRRIYRTLQRAVACLAVDGTAMRCVRADDRNGHDVMQDVYEGVAAAACVIVETTGHNPNVFLELGIAVTLGKPLVLITRDDLQTIPFNLRRFRHFTFGVSAVEQDQLGQKVIDAVRDATGASQHATLQLLAARTVESPPPQSAAIQSSRSSLDALLGPTSEQTSFFPSLSPSHDDRDFIKELLRPYRPHNGV